MRNKSQKENNTITKTSDNLRRKNNKPTNKKDNNAVGAPDIFFRRYVK